MQQRGRAESRVDGGLRYEQAVGLQCWGKLRGGKRRQARCELITLMLQAAEQQACLINCQACLFDLWQSGKLVWYQAVVYT